MRSAHNDSGEVPFKSETVAPAAKLVVPAFVLVTGVLVLGDSLRAWLMLGLPLSLFGLFYLSAAQVRPGKKTLRYRYWYFQQWRDLDYSRIRDCRVSWLPFIGGATLHR